MGIGINSCTQANGSTTAVSPSAATTSGSTLIVGVSIFGAGFHATTPIQDSKGNTWVQIGTETGGANSRVIRRYKAVNITGGAGHTVTAQADAAGYFVLSVCEVLGAPASPTVLSNIQADTSSPYTSGTVAPATASVLIGFNFSDASDVGTGTEADTWGGDFAAGDKLGEVTNCSIGDCGSLAANVKSSGTFGSSVTISGVTIGTSVVAVVSVETAAGGGPAYNAVPQMTQYRRRMLNG